MYMPNNIIVIITIDECSSKLYTLRVMHHGSIHYECDCFMYLDLGQLQHLVQLITSSGSAEGDDVNDLLADLITVASAFASLIYDQIEANASNEELSIRCKQVWDALEETPKMSLIMVGKLTLI